MATPAWDVVLPRREPDGPARVDRRAGAVRAVRDDRRLQHLAARERATRRLAERDVDRDDLPGRAREALRAVDGLAARELDPAGDRGPGVTVDRDADPHLPLALQAGALAL